MKALFTPSFNRSAKKLHPNEKKHLDEAIRELLLIPTLGEEKKGDLAGIYVYKYKIQSRLWLLAYSVEPELFIILRLVGPHENFYRRLKERAGN